jgi:hypothetical protein
MQTVTRRDALKAFVSSMGAVIGAPVLSEAAWAQALAVREQAAAAPPTGLKFFTEAEHRTVDVLSEAIIPADARSGGASAAKVADFIDYLLSGAADDERALWRDGLTALDTISTERSKHPFAEAAAGQRVALLTEISANEASPNTPLERLFVAAKERTIQGYYTSEIGIHKELGYRGQQFINEFIGCTHPEHMS